MGASRLSLRRTCGKNSARQFSSGNHGAELCGRPVGGRSGRRGFSGRPRRGGAEREILALIKRGATMAALSKAASFRTCR